jgi:hypothetical protein
MMQSAPHPPTPELTITLTIRSVSVIVMFQQLSEFTGPKLPFFFCQEAWANRKIAAKALTAG